MPEKEAQSKFGADHTETRATMRRQAYFPDPFFAGDQNRKQQLSSKSKPILPEDMDKKRFRVGYGRSRNLHPHIEISSNHFRSYIFKHNTSKAKQWALRCRASQGRYQGWRTVETLEGKTTMQYPNSTANYLGENQRYLR